jgi:hypothetical protein
LLGDFRNIHVRNIKEQCFYVVPAGTFAKERRAKHTSTTDGLCFLTGRCREIILKTIRATVQLWDVRRTVIMRMQEAEEFPLLEAVAKVRILKTQ